jgi:hypothetical protein
MSLLGKFFADDSLQENSSRETSGGISYVFCKTRSFGCCFRIESVKKLILISDRLVELKFFVLLFWPIWDFNPRVFGLKVNNGDQAAN